MRETTAPTNGIESTDSIATPQPSPLPGFTESIGLTAPPPLSKPKWDLAEIRLPQDYAVSKETVQASVPIGKPRPQVYFQAHPEWQLLVATLTFEDSMYVVYPTLHAALDGDYQIKHIVPYITRDGNVGLWPLSQLQPSGRTDTWTQSAHRILVAARVGWVRMRSNMRLQAYDLIKPKVTWDQPVWPEQEFEELVQTAFGDRAINTLDHPVVRALHGEA